MISLDGVHIFARVLLVCGVLTLTFALRTLRHPVLQKLGAAGIFATSYLIGYLFTGWPMVGVVLASSWLFLPWVELITRVRKISIPAERQLRHRAPPNSHHFPALSELTEEIEAEGFEHADDSGFDTEDGQQFFRFFYKRDERIQAAICLVDQNDIAFYYVRVSSRGRDGVLWLTWNYPISYNLQFVPRWKVKWTRGDRSFLEILDAHRNALLKHGVKVEDLEELNPDEMQAMTQTDLHHEITYNVSTGLLKKVSESAVRYSWRGLMYLWIQFLRDLVRLS